jgi:hypothetical protein
VRRLGPSLEGPFSAVGKMKDGHRVSHLQQFMALAARERGYIAAIQFNSIHINKDQYYSKTW